MTAAMVEELRQVTAERDEARARVAAHAAEQAVELRTIQALCDEAASLRATLAEIRAAWAIHDRVASGGRITALATLRRLLGDG